MRPARFAIRLIPTIVIPLFLATTARSDQWKIPDIKLDPNAKHPVVACTPAELGRLQKAYKGEGPEQKVVAAMVREGDRAIAAPLEFPPRGGQHNQWYQCEKCQLGLKTVDDTHHQCPRCKTVYSGEPYDDVVFSRKHGQNLRNMASAAWAYAVTGEKKYAEYSARVLRGYAKRYLDYPYHSASRTLSGWGLKSGGRLCPQTLGEASSMASRIAPSYDLIHDSGVLSAADHELIRSRLVLPMLRNIAKNRGGKSNWQTWHNAAMLTGGAVLGDVEWVRGAIANPTSGFAYQMKVSVTEDGMWYENSWGYHFYTLSAMVHIVEGARRLGIDLWSHPALKKMFTLPVDYAMPGGLLPRLGDDVNSRVSSASRYLEPAYHAYGDPAMLPHLPERPSKESVLLGRSVGPRPDPPRLESKVFRGAGHAILRADGDAGLAAAVTFGPYGGFHGHYDKLSFVLFGGGQELGVDPGRASSQAYRLPIHAKWYKATIGHNTVLVDQASQKPASGKLEAFVAEKHFVAVVTSCDAAYKGVRHRRLLCLLPAYLVVFDDLVSEKNHRFDWVYHNRGTVAECDVAAKQSSLDSDYPGGEYVANVKAGTTDEPVRIAFKGPRVTTHLTVDAADATEVRTGDGVGASILDRVPMAMVTRHGQGTRFAAVLEPVAKGQQPTVDSVSLEAADGTARITVRQREKSTLITVDAAGRVTVAPGK